MSDLTVEYYIREVPSRKRMKRRACPIWSVERETGGREWKWPGRDTTTG